MTTPTTGTYVDSWWGIYAPARALLVAHELGAPVPAESLALAHRELASSSDNPEAADPLTFEQHETLTSDLDAAEHWLNTHRTWPGRTAWGWTDGSWEHALSPDANNRPTLRFYVDVYSHDTNPTSSEDAIDSGYVDPDWSAWWPTADTGPIWELDLLDLLDLDYHPNHLATLAATRALEWVGTVDHIDTTATTVAVYGAEAIDDLRGTRGLPLASHWSMREAHLIGLTSDEIYRITHQLITNP